jgi:YidC/Oxa1 family membrane protein insertase
VATIPFPGAPAGTSPGVWDKGAGVDFRRVLLFFGLSLLSIFLYGEIVSRLYGRPGPPADQIAGRPADVDRPLLPEAERETPPAPPPPRPVATPAPPGRSVVIDTDVLRAEWTTTGARLRSLKLKRYRETTARDSPYLELVDVPRGQPLPLGLEVGPERARDDLVSYRVDRETLTVSGEETASVRFRGSVGGIEVEKEIRFSGGEYAMDLIVRAEGSRLGDAPTTALDLTTGYTGNQSSGGWFGGVTGTNQPRGIIVLEGRRLRHETLDTLEAESLTFETPRWAGFSDQYFAGLAVPAAAESVQVTAPRIDPGQAAVIRMEVPLDLAGAPAIGEAAFKIYYGPKDLDILEHAAPSLERAVDFGYFWFAAMPLHWALVASHGVTGNYGLDIILVSTLIKLLFLPLTRKSMESMRAMQKLQPEMMKIRERYKDDAQRLQKETMELYRRHRVNPLSGCLPMLLQLPVFVGLYNALLNSIELRHAPFVWWITDLSAPERLTIAGVGIPMLAIIMGATMLVQQWMAPAAGDPMQRRMMMIMPVMFTFMFINFPSGLVLYWLINNVLTIGQQYFVLNRTAG